MNDENLIGTPAASWADGEGIWLEREEEGE